MANEEGKPPKSKRQEHIDALKEARAHLEAAEKAFRELNLNLTDLRKKIDGMPHDPHEGDTHNG